MIIVILQVAAGVVRLNTLNTTQRQKYYPTGMPPFPVFGIKSDNTPTIGWTHKVTTKSLQGQGILSVYSEILRQHSIGVNCSHIPGELNTLADQISRPSDPSSSLSARTAQIIQHKPSMATWDFFQPNPELLQLLYSKLFTPHSLDPIKLPKQLGQFVPTKSII